MKRLLILFLFATGGWIPSSEANDTPPPLTAEMAVAAGNQLWTREDAVFSQKVGEKTAISYVQEDIDRLHTILAAPDSSRYLVRTQVIYEKFNETPPAFMPEYLNGRLAVAKLLQLYVRWGNSMVRTGGRIPSAWPYKRYVRSSIPFMSGHKIAGDVADDFRKAAPGRLRRIGGNQNKFEKFLQESYSHFPYDRELMEKVLEHAEKYFPKPAGELKKSYQILHEHDLPVHLHREWHNAIHPGAWNLDGRRGHNPCLEGSAPYARTEEEIVDHFLMALGPDPDPLLTHRLFSYNPDGGRSQKEIVILSFESLKRRHGEEAALAPLLRILKDPNPEFRKQAALSLEALGLRARGAYDALRAQEARETKETMKYRVGRAATAVMSQSESTAIQLADRFRRAEGFSRNQERSRILKEIHPHRRWATLSVEDLLKVHPRPDTRHLYVDLMAEALAKKPEDFDLALQGEDGAAVNAVRALVQAAADRKIHQDRVIERLLELVNETESTSIEGAILQELVILRPLKAEELEKFHHLSPNLPLQDYGLLLPHVLRFTAGKDEKFALKIFKIFSPSRYSHKKALGMSYMLAAVPQSIPLIDITHFSEFDYFIDHFSQVEEWLTVDQVINNLQDTFDHPKSRENFFHILSSPAFVQGNPWYEAVYRHLPPEKLDLSVDQVLAGSNIHRADPTYLVKFFQAKGHRSVLLTSPQLGEKKIGLFPLGKRLRVGFPGPGDTVRWAGRWIFTVLSPSGDIQQIRRIFIPEEPHSTHFLTDGERGIILFAENQETSFVFMDLTGPYFEPLFPRPLFDLSDPSKPNALPEAWVNVARKKLRSPRPQERIPAQTILAGEDLGVRDAMTWMERHFSRGARPGERDIPHLCNLLLLSKKHREIVYEKDPNLLLYLADSCENGDLWFFSIVESKQTKDRFVQLISDRLQIMATDKRFDPKVLAEILNQIVPFHPVYPRVYGALLNQAITHSDDREKYLAEFTETLLNSDRILWNFKIHLNSPIQIHTGRAYYLDGLAFNPKLPPQVRKKLVRRLISERSDLPRFQTEQERKMLLEAIPAQEKDLMEKVKNEKLFIPSPEKKKK